MDTKIRYKSYEGWMTLTSERRTRTPSMHTLYPLPTTKWREWTQWTRVERVLSRSNTLQLYPSLPWEIENTRTDGHGWKRTEDVFGCWKYCEIKKRTQKKKHLCSFGFLIDSVVTSVDRERKKKLRTPAWSYQTCFGIQQHVLCD